MQTNAQYSLQEALLTKLNNLTSSKCGILYFGSSFSEVGTDPKMDIL